MPPKNETTTVFVVKHNNELVDEDIAQHILSLDLVSRLNIEPNAHIVTPDRIKALLERVIKDYARVVAVAIPPENMDDPDEYVASVLDSMVDAEAQTQMAQLARELSEP